MTFPYLNNQIRREIFINRDQIYLEKRIDWFMSKTGFKKDDEYVNKYVRSGALNYNNPNNWEAEAVVSISPKETILTVTLVINFFKFTTPLPRDQHGEQPQTWNEDYWNMLADDFEVALNTDKDYELEHRKISGKVEEINASGCAATLAHSFSLLLFLLVFSAVGIAFFPRLDFQQRTFIAMILATAVQTCIYLLYKKHHDKQLAALRHDRVTVLTKDTK